MSIRMLPINFIFSRFPRLVRDTATRLGKQVELHLYGEHTELDKSVIEKLSDPLTHIVRNSIDHGIETPAERLAAGKPAEGRITIRARHHAGMLVLELSDDGGGIDLQRLRETVLNRQFATAETAAQLSEEELLAFLFLPGFSMREQSPRCPVAASDWTPCSTWSASCVAACAWSNARGRARCSTSRCR